MIGPPIRSPQRQTTRRPGHSWEGAVLRLPAWSTAMPSVATTCEYGNNPEVRVVLSERLPIASEMHRRNISRMITSARKISTYEASDTELQWAGETWPRLHHVAAGASCARRGGPRRRLGL